MSIGGPIKIGPWGGDGGTMFDATDLPFRLDTMTIRAGYFIDSVGYTYVDEAGKKHTAGPFGGTGGQLTTIQFAPTEWVKKLTGSIGIRSGKPVVASLEIETNTKKYGPYGRLYQDNSFSVPMPEGFSLTGFFGRAGSLIDAIGVYVAYDKFTKADATEETSGN